MSKYCTKCGAENESNSKFCEKCGGSLEKNNNNSRKEINCPFCNEKIPMSTDKCDNCGEWLNLSAVHKLNNHNVVVLGIIGLIIYTFNILLIMLNIVYIYESYVNVSLLIFGWILFSILLIMGLFITKKNSLNGGIIIIVFLILFAIYTIVFRGDNLITLIGLLILLFSGVLAILNVKNVPILDDIWKP